MMLVGPMKRKMILSVVLTMVITIMVFAVIGILLISRYSDRIERLEAQAEVEERYVLNSDLPVNHVITRADLVLKQVKAETIPADSFSKETIVTADNKEMITAATGEAFKTGDRIQSIEFLIGRRLKVDATKNTILTDGILFELDEEINKDTRIQEFNMILLPSNLVENEYIDVRLLLPTGEDYSVLIGKKVESYVNDTIFIRLTEDEILTMGSAIVEAYMTEGAKLYANKYVNPSTQLYKYETIDYVARYDAAFDAVLEALRAAEEAELRTEILIEQPELSEEEITALVANRLTVSSADVTLEQIVANSTLTIDIASVIKNAKETNDTATLDKYSNYTVRSKNEIERTYAVRTEVLDAIIRNPNILQVVKNGFTADRNIEEELAEIEMNEMAGIVSPNEDEVSRIKEALTKELETQRNERISYLESLIEE